MTHAYLPLAALLAILATAADLPRQAAPAVRICPCDYKAGVPCGCPPGACECGDVCFCLRPGKDCNVTARICPCNYRVDPPIPCDCAGGECSCGALCWCPFPGPRCRLVSASCCCQPPFNEMCDCPDSHCPCKACPCCCCPGK